MDINLTDKTLDFANERLDLAIRAEPLPPLELVAHRLAEDKEIIVVATAVADRFDGARRPEQLAGEAWVMHAETPLRRELVDTGGERVSRDLHGRVTTTSSLNVVKFVQGGMGLGLLPSSLVDEAVAEGSLVRILPEWTGRTFGVFVVYPPRKLLPVKVTRFIEALERTVASVGLTPSGEVESR